jgi:hypothetical protein
LELVALAGLTGIHAPAPVYAGPSLPARVVIQADYSGWSHASTNLTLTLSNGVYVAGAYAVAPALISTLLKAAARPWPQPATNAWPPFIVDPANLGLDATWAKSNHQRLIEAYAGNGEKGVFPNASERQRAWLSKAAADVELLGEAVRGGFGGGWTDDYPSLEVRFESDAGPTPGQVTRLSTRAQQTFMLPWRVEGGKRDCSSANADISRALARILPPGFLNRDRLSGDLFQLVVGQFPGLTRVQEFMKKATLEETLGADAPRLLAGFELQQGWIPGNYGRFPETYVATLHRTNWPERLTIPMQSRIEKGVVTSLKAILTHADARVEPVLNQGWLVSRLKGPGQVSLGVNAEGSPDHQWLRGHMDKVGRAGFYDRIQPALSRAVGFILREGVRRSSEWAVLEDGRLLLYGFTGDGVLDWKPDQLGFKGDERLLHSMSINFVGVFLGPDGRITEVVPPDGK